MVLSDERRGGDRPHPRAPGAQALFGIPGEVLAVTIPFEGILDCPDRPRTRGRICDLSMRGAVPLGAWSIHTPHPCTPKFSVQVVRGRAMRLGLRRASVLLKLCTVSCTVRIAEHVAHVLHVLYAIAFPSKNGDVPPRVPCRGSHIRGPRTVYEIGTCCQPHNPKGMWSW